MYELRVLSGQHQGAALPLCGDAWCIGRDDSADLFLQDNGVGTKHAELFLKENCWTLHLAESTGCDFYEQGRMEYVLNENTPFSLGGVWLCITSSEMSWGEIKRPDAGEEVQKEAEKKEDVHSEHSVKIASKQNNENYRYAKVMRLVSFTIMLLLSCTILSWILQPTIAQTGRDENQRPVLATLQEMRPALLAMLRERNLIPGVKIDMQKGKIVLYGELSKERILILDRMIARFHNEYNAMPQLVNNTRPLSEKLPFRIVQVSTGGHANIVTDEGKRVFIGDDIDGLHLASITDNRILFTGNKNIEVNW